MDLDESDLIQLEQWLLMSQSNDNEAIKAATPAIQGVVAKPEGPDYFRAIIEHSGEPRARSAAAVYLFSSIKMQMRTMNPRRQEKFGAFFLQQIPVPNQDPTSLSQCIAGVHLILKCRRLQWKGLTDELDSLKDELNPGKFRLLSEVIGLLPNEYLMERYPLFGAAAAAALQCKDWELIGYGLRVIATLLGCSQSLSGFEQCFDLIIGLCSIIFQQSSPIQKSFFEGVERIFSSNVFDPRLPVAVMTALSEQDVDSDEMEAALGALEPSVSFMVQEHALMYTDLAVHCLEKYIVQNGAIPPSPLGPITVVFREFKHELVYSFLLQRARSYAETNLCMSLLIFVPVVEAADEQISGDIEFLVELVKAALMSGDALNCQAACVLLHFSEDAEDMIMHFPELLPPVIRLSVSHDGDVRHWAFQASQSMVAREIQIDGILQLVWEIKGSVHPSDQGEFLILLASVIRNSDVDDSQLREICDFLRPIIENINEPLDASAALWVLCQLIPHDEGTMFPLIQSTVPAIRAGCVLNNEDARVRTLEYLAEVVKNYREQALPLVNEVSNEIAALLRKNRLQERVLVVLLGTACQIARAGGQAIIPDVMKRIQKCMGNEATMTVAVISWKSMVVILGPEQVLEGFTTVAGICKETEDEDTCAACLATLAKCIRVASDSMLETMLPGAAEICQAFLTGNLPSLRGKQTTDGSSDVPVELLENFDRLTSAVVAYKSPFVEPLCLEMLKLLNRKENVYKNSALGVVIDAIEKETLPDTVTAQVVSILPQLMSDAPSMIRQNLVFMLNVILQKHPDFVAQIQQVWPILIQWWAKSQENREGCSMIISNLASLFFLIEARSKGTVPDEMIAQMLEAFPPVDRTETSSRCTNLLTIVSQSPSLSLPIRINLAVGIGRLVTLSTKKLSKLSLDPSLLSNLVQLLKSLGQSDPAVHEALAARFQASASKLAKISEILST